RRAMSCAFSNSSACAVAPKFPPFPPPTNTDFFSTIGCAIPFYLPRALSPISRLVNRPTRSQGKDGQVQRDQYTADKNRHYNQDHRFNQRHGRAQRRLHVYF